ncbi:MULTISPECIES: CBS domain-containing protein [Thermomonospora]|uniref:CBS domain containing membrane protein n=1 Tax=Thermomonospora curvata (strain ATCC 19995 / DSM 43183 / JCM 3096 / KCTC 9072 / NBRC 15933 / NCIMB 10081 / Henssen B9) TaxID=471852 RepID=D1AEN3_THECD|nr:MULTISPECIES: CBS domain-containing protein [Thermomonospora]ACY97608.1 CBS domain containing membrane protein [Thermomonospora curvata DSM 43183]PKK14552.1 MAG: inosine-5'-monophosphate dehydrogenase [Thermomonospora sp. CIF 1]
MKGRRVQELMTENVVSVRAETPFVEIVELIEEHRIDAVPVVDADRRVIGIVSESDLLHKQEFGGPRRTPSGLLGALRRRRAQAKAGAVNARGLMTTPVITVSPQATAAEAARIMARHKVDQLPVTDDDGRLVGIVARSDVLRVFLRSDEEIREDVVEQVIVRTLWQDPSTVQVRVHDGVVHLSGRVETKSLIPILTRFVAEVDGVVDVTEELTYEFDDSGRVPIPRA